MTAFCAQRFQAIYPWKSGGKKKHKKVELQRDSFYQAAEDHFCEKPTIINFSTSSVLASQHGTIADIRSSKTCFEWLSIYRHTKKRNDDTTVPTLDY